MNILPKVIVEIHARFPSNVHDRHDKVVLGDYHMYGALLTSTSVPIMLDLPRISHEVRALELFENGDVEIEFDIFDTEQGRLLAELCKGGAPLKMHLIFADDDKLVTAHFTPTAAKSLKEEE